MYSIKDIAKMAGVSPSTVSRVINDSKKVNEETKMKINKIIRQVDYSPNPMAKAMRTKKSNFVGVIISDITDPFFSELYYIIWEYLAKYGYNALLINLPLDSYANKKTDIFYNLDYWNIAGMIFCFNSELYELNKIPSNGEKRIPFVIIGHSAEQNDQEGVFLNTEEGMYRAVKYFINQGEKRIAFFGGRKEWHGKNNTGGWADPRLKGYKKALYEDNIKFDENLIFSCDLNLNGGQEAAEQFLNLKDRPSAIVTVNDGIAAGAIKFFLKNGIKVPQDISIFGFDDNLLAKASFPELSTVRVPSTLIGESAAKMLVNKINKRNRKFDRKTISTELVIRGTTK